MGLSLPILLVNNFVVVVVVVVIVKGLSLGLNSLGLVKEDGL
jgi:hypothetical protein